MDYKVLHNLAICAEESEHGGPGTAVRTKADLQSWPLAGIWELRFMEGSHCSLINMAHCAKTVYASSVAYAEHLFLWGSGIFVIAKQRMPV